MVYGTLLAISRLRHFLCFRGQHGVRTAALLSSVVLNTTKSRDRPLTVQSIPWYMEPYYLQ